MALGKVKGPLAALILRVWDGRPERPVDGGCTVVSGEGLPPYVKGLDESFPPWGPMDQLSLEAPPPKLLFSVLLGRCGTHRGASALR